MSEQNEFAQFARTHQQAPAAATQNAESSLTRDIAKLAGQGIAWYLGLSVTVGLGHLAVRKARAALGIANTITVTVSAED